jgi:RNA 3'-terminal phosphate cyclase (ATP)
MIRIDGAVGDGGGQILRSALTLSMATGKPFVIERIRAGRARPGLMRQHLMAVQAATRISGAQTEGAEVGATALSFAPGSVPAGDYLFDIGSAGSTSLVLQTVLPALARAAAPSRVVIRGGTANLAAPPFDFIDRAFAPLLRRMGYRVDLTLTRPGFYPAGGGEIVAAIAPPAAARPLVIETRGARLSHGGVAVVANLPFDIARREAARLRALLNWEDGAIAAKTEARATGPGNIVVATLAYENVTEVFVAFGHVGATSEAVAEECADAVKAWLAGAHSVGPHLADQLLLPMALSGGGAFVTTRPTPHLTTNIAVIETFLGPRIACADLGDGRWRVEVAADAG